MFCLQPCKKCYDKSALYPSMNLQKENKFIEADFEYVRCSDKDEVAIYRKRK